MHKQVVRKEADAHPIDIDPSFRLYYVEVEADLATPTAISAVGEALERMSSGLDVDHHVVPGRRRRCAPASTPRRSPSRDGGVAIWPGFHDTALGVAIDVGSTTVAGHLCDLSTGEVLATAGR